MGEGFPFFRVSVGTLASLCCHVCSLPTLAHYYITSSVVCRREQTVKLCRVAVLVWGRVKGVGCLWMGAMCVVSRASFRLWWCVGWCGGWQCEGLVTDGCVLLEGC